MVKGDAIYEEVSTSGSVSREILRHRHLVIHHCQLVSYQFILSQCLFPSESCFIGPESKMDMLVVVYGPHVGLLGSG
ncbi:hypothetical protein CEXT_554101 [Caerostris extrusa]|uniref:Uncharacterized protein n=1 Tax=Caerostris extrusa TaxID=172846 RepID=A0AAV4PBB0_CAEEX|nr:hypothetical protein CEXT_554101 [Caerostris extrusa]